VGKEAQVCCAALSAVPNEAVVPVREVDGNLSPYEAGWTAMSEAFNPSFGSADAGSSLPGGPGVGVLPSRIALAISPAFHFAYLIFSFSCLFIKTWN